MLEWALRTMQSTTSDLSMAGLTAVGVIACAFSLDWIRQFWNSPRDLTFMVEFRAGLEYEGRQLSFRQALPIGLLGLLLMSAALLIDSVGGPLGIAGVLLLASAPAGVLTLIVWFFGRPDRLIVPALRNRKVRDPD
jgi:hypothetical protein